MSWVLISTSVRWSPSILVYSSRVTRSSGRSAEVLRDRGGELGDQITLPPGQERFEILVRQVADERLDPHGLVVGEHGVDQASDPAVAGLGNLGKDLFLLGHDDARLPVIRLEGVHIPDCA